jgi:hypothetical protein
VDWELHGTPQLIQHTDSKRTSTAITEDITPVAIQHDANRDGSARSRFMGRNHSSSGPKNPSTTPTNNSIGLKLSNELQDATDESLEQANERLERMNERMKMPDDPPVPTPACRDAAHEDGGEANDRRTASNEAFPVI